MKNYLIIFCLTIATRCFGQTDPIIALPNAHAHNDYEHTRPLLDALAQGFTSIEVDVFLIDGEIYVYHDLPEQVNPKRTLKKMYLDPLLELSRQNGGKVYPKHDILFYLMIDIKKDGRLVYEKLKAIFKDYQEMLTSYSGTTTTRRAITVFLSGDRPRQQIFQEEERWMALDGRPTDIGRFIDPSYMPVISDNYNNHFKWKGETPEMPSEDWRKLRMMTANAHGEGKKIRFWASPEKEVVWKALLRAQVDFINTDELVRFRQFVRK